MEIKKCSVNDVALLATMNKQLIEDEKSDNPMTIPELEKRMEGFLNGEYHAYYFIDEDNIVGYALIRHTSNPLYLRQFFIRREFRRKHYGTLAFEQLLSDLEIKNIDIEVLSWNERGMKFWEKVGFKERSS